MLGCLLALELFLGGCASRDTARRSADEWFALGREQLAQRKYGKAEGAFSKLLEQHPQDRRRAEALLGMADALYADKRYEEAKFQYRRFLEIYPTNPQADNAQFHIAMSAFLRMKSIDRDQTIIQEALQEFQRLLQSYPHSTHTDEAKQKLAMCRERLAAAELSVGRFYYKKGAYPAAIGRFDRLRRLSPEVSFADEVLFLLGDAYARNGNLPEAATVFEELVKRYPNSSYASGAKGRLVSRH